MPVKLKPLLVGQLMLLFMIVNQAANALTNALYFGDKWLYAILHTVACVCMVSMTSIWIALLQLSRRNSIAVEADPASRVPQTRLEFCLYLGMIAVASLFALLYWVTLFTKWTAPQVPSGYRSALYIVGLSLAAGTGWLVAEGIRTVYRAQRQASAAKKVTS